MINLGGLKYRDSFLSRRLVDAPSRPALTLLAQGAPVQGMRRSVPLVGTSRRGKRPGRWSCPVVKSE